MTPSVHLDDPCDERAIRAFEAVLAKRRAPTLRMVRRSLLRQKARPHLSSKPRKLPGAALLIASRPARAKVRPHGLGTT